MAKKSGSDKSKLTKAVPADAKAAKTSHAKPKSSNADTVKLKSAKASPAKPKPANAGLVKPKPANSTSAKSRPASSGTVKTKASKSSPAKSKPAQKSPSSKSEVLRFAQPFYTTVPIADRAHIPGVGNRMVDYIANKLEKIPEPLRDPTMTLEDIIGKAGSDSVILSKSISFHVTGDTGDPKQDMQEPVAIAMSNDYDAAHPDKSPAFFLHLGDVIYYKNTDEGYHEQFYDPYKKYPGKIIAIPGNHDGELFNFKGVSSGQTVTLEAFMKNFCQPSPSIPPAAGAIYRQMVNQPGVYWVLNAPFVDIIGLYSNIAEGPGFISGQTIGTKQKDWLIKTLKDINSSRQKGQRKALLIAVHHPPFSIAGHSPSVDMLNDIDDALNTAHILPDAVLSGHSHTYQRFTRFSSLDKRNYEIPFIIAGSGGHNISPVKPPDGQKQGDHILISALSGYGYLTITVSEQKLAIQFTQVEIDKQHVFDKVEVDLKTNRIV